MQGAGKQAFITSYMPNSQKIASKLASINLKTPTPAPPLTLKREKGVLGSNSLWITQFFKKVGKLEDTLEEMPQQGTAGKEDKLVTYTARLEANIRMDDYLCEYSNVQKSPIATHMKTTYVPVIPQERPTNVSDQVEPEDDQQVDVQVQCPQQTATSFIIPTNCQCTYDQPGYTCLLFFLGTKHLTEY